MIDPGHPFSVPMEDISAALEDRLRFGVEQPGNQVFVYQEEISTYEIGRLVDSITRVTGIAADGGFSEFEPSTDYRFSNNRIIWQSGGSAPPLGGKFTVEYQYREPAAGITDFNPGSVAGTVLRSVAREIKLLYEQMDQAYRRAFIDIATGVALDNVVALLGVVRTPAQKAHGSVRFSVKKAALDDLIIPVGTRVADEGDRAFFTLPASASSADAILPAGSLSVDVPIEAVSPGPAGNVNADSISIMPSPPPGINGVTNPEVTSGGREAESDDNLRERAKHALEQAGKATLNAIRFSVLAVPGVDDVQVLDQSVDESIPLGEVQVRYSGSAEAALVSAAVDNTRSAGILARLAEVNDVLIAGVVYVIPEADFNDAALDEFAAEIDSFLGKLKIGQALSVKKLSAPVYLIAGLADVAEAQLTYQHLEDSNNPGVFLDGDISSDPFFVGNTERVKIATPGPVIKVVQSLAATAASPGVGNHSFGLSLLDAGEAPIHFKQFSLDLSAVMVAYLQSNDQAETIGLFSTQVSISDDIEGEVILSTGGFDPMRHKSNVDVRFTAKAYPGIDTSAATVTINL